MGFFKALAYVAGGVGAVVLAPVTGGSSLALAIGAMGTTTAAGAAIGAGIGATAAALDHGMSGKKESYNQGYQHGEKVGIKVGYRIAADKYEEKMRGLLERLTCYQDFDKKILAMYAVGLATANADGDISPEELEELDAFAGGISTGNFPLHIKTAVSKLRKKPPTLQEALEFARNAKLPKNDIDDIIDIIVNADGFVHHEEKQFMAQWQSMSFEYQNAIA